MTKLTIENLIGTGAHFGHVTSRWHPSYKPYIFMEKNGVHIIDLKQTVDCLGRATDAAGDLVRQGGTVLFIGTKKQAKDILQQEADRCGMYYVVERWLGGTLTNFSTIKRSIKRLHQLEKDADTLYQSLTKKEILRLERERIRLSDQHRGIKDMKHLPDAVFIVDIRYEETAVREALRLEIPIFAIVDSNTDPTVVDYPIPANDDSLRTIQLIASAFADAIISARGGQSFALDEEAMTGESSVQESVTAEPTKAEEAAEPVADDVPAEPVEAVAEETVEAESAVEEKTE